MASRSRVRYGTTVIKRMEIENNNMGDCSATNMTAFAINGTTAYCVKRNNSIDKATIYTINNFATATVESNRKIIPYATYGMTYYNSQLYIATKGSKIVRVSAAVNNTTTKVFDATTGTTALGPQAITHYTGNEFMLMANSLNSGTDTLCIAVGTFNESIGKFVEDTVKRFYVKNTVDSEGYTQVQDIYYDSMYGLFIVLNEKVNGAYTTSNIILRVDLSRVDDTLYNGKKFYYPVAEFKFVGKTAEYRQLNVESLAIDSQGKMYVVTNLVAVSGAKDGFTKDGMFYIGNVRFNKNKPFWVKIYGRNVSSIPDKTGTTTDGKQYICNNPAGLALNGNVGYCVKTDTRSSSACQDKASFFYKTSNYTTTGFAAQGSLLTNLGHGNGMGFANNALYVAAYSVVDSSKRDIVKLSTDGKVIETYTLSNRKIGAISGYKNNKLIMHDYLYPGEKKGEYFHFVIGTFTGKTTFNTEKQFKVLNPAFAESATVFQDMHYDPVFGLFATTRASGDDYIIRVSASVIDNAPNNGTINADEFYYIDAGIIEIESLCLGDDGILYYTDNRGDDKEFAKFLTLTHYKS